jgi:hypothetical protein
MNIAPEFPRDHVALGDTDFACCDVIGQSAATVLRSIHPILRRAFACLIGARRTYAAILGNGPVMVNK